jgi:hypothetical protein
LGDVQGPQTFVKIQAGDIRNVFSDMLEPASSQAQMILEIPDSKGRRRYWAPELISAL